MFGIKGNMKITFLRYYLGILVDLSSGFQIIIIIIINNQPTDKV